MSKMQKRTRSAAPFREVDMDVWQCVANSIAAPNSLWNFAQKCMLRSVCKSAAGIDISLPNVRTKGCGTCEHCNGVSQWTDSSVSCCTLVQGVAWVAPTFHYTVSMETLPEHVEAYDVDERCMIKVFHKRAYHNKCTVEMGTTKVECIWDPDTRRIFWKSGKTMLCRFGCHIYDQLQAPSARTRDVQAEVERWQDVMTKPLAYWRVSKKQMYVEPYSNRHGNEKGPMIYSILRTNNISTLTHLVLSEVSIQPDFSQALAEGLAVALPTLPALTALDVSYNRISPAAVKAICDNGVHLKVLAIAGAAPQSVTACRAMRQMIPRLSLLDISHVEWPDSQSRRLYRALARSKIDALYMYGEPKYPSFTLSLGVDPCTSIYVGGFNVTGRENRACYLSFFCMGHVKLYFSRLDTGPFDQVKLCMPSSSGIRSRIRGRVEVLPLVDAFALPHNAELQRIQHAVHVMRDTNMQQAGCGSDSEEEDDEDADSGTHAAAGPSSFGATWEEVHADGEGSITGTMQADSEPDESDVNVKRFKHADRERDRYMWQWMDYTCKCGAVWPAWSVTISWRQTCVSMCNTGKKACTSRPEYTRVCAGEEFVISSSNRLVPAVDDVRRARPDTLLAVHPVWGAQEFARNADGSKRLTTQQDSPVDAVTSTAAM